MNLKSMVISIALISPTIFFASSVQSQETEQEGITLFGQKLSGTAFVGGAYAPTFSGSDESSFGAAVSLDLEWGKYLFLNDKGLGAYVLKPEDDTGLTAGVAVGYDFISRKSADDTRLTGLTDIEGSALATGFVEYDFGIAGVEVDVSRALGSDGHEGTTINAAIEVFVPINERFILSASPFVTWGDDNYTSSMYGVSAAEAGASSFNQYDASAGIEKYGIQFQAAYMFTQKIGVAGSVEYGRLAGDAKDSPIAFDQDQTTAAIGVLYKF